MVTDTTMIVTVEKECPDVCEKTIQHETCYQCPCIHQNCESQRPNSCGACVYKAY